MAKRKTYKQSPPPRRKFKYNKAYADLGDYLLNIAEEIRRKVFNCDTAVRDSVSEGLAYIVQAGNDCTAQNIEFNTTEQWMSFIDNATADWFRERGYAEWFCVAAANGFRLSRPRTLDERIIKVRRVTARKPKPKPKTKL